MNTPFSIVIRTTDGKPSAEHKKSNNLHSSVEAVSVIVGFYHVVEINNTKTYWYAFSFSPLSFVYILILNN